MPDQLVEKFHLLRKGTMVVEEGPVLGTVSIKLLSGLQLFLRISVAPRSTEMGSIIPLWCSFPAW